MPTLTLIRHGQAVRFASEQTDHQRPLTGQGRTDIERLGQLLSAGCPKPDLVLASDACRTVETAELLAGSSPRLVLESCLYLASLDDLLQRLQQLPSTVVHAWLIGHNPGLLDLAALLSADRITSLATGAAAHFQVIGPWSGLEAGQAELVEEFR